MNLGCLLAGRADFLVPHLLPLCRERVGEDLWKWALNTALAEPVPLPWVLPKGCCANEGRPVFHTCPGCFPSPLCGSPPFPLLLLPLPLTSDLSLGEGGKTPARLPLTGVSLGQVCRQQFVALHSEKILQDLSEFMLEKYCRYS